MENGTNPTQKKTLGEEETEIRKEKLLKALEESRGIVIYACRAAGVHRDTYYEYMNNDDSFKRQVRSIKEDQKDIVEAALLSNIAEKKEASIFFYLKTQAKDRGYVEKLEIDNNLGFMSLLKKASMESDEGE